MRNFQLSLQFSEKVSPPTTGNNRLSIAMTYVFVRNTGRHHCEIFIALAILCLACLV